MTKRYVQSFHRVEGSPPTPYEGEIIGEQGHYWKLKVRVGKGYKTFRCLKAACSSTPYYTNEGTDIQQESHTEDNTSAVQEPRANCKVAAKNTKVSRLQRSGHRQDQRSSGSVQPKEKGWRKVFTRSSP
jgi:hypothetical protein